MLLVNLMVYGVTFYTSELLTLPWYYSALIAFATVVVLSWIFFQIKRKSRPAYGILKTLLGFCLALWAIVDIRIDRENVKGIALWISILLAVDFVVDGLDDAFPDRGQQGAGVDSDETPTPVQA